MFSRVVMCVMAAAMLASPAARSEEGDYSALQTFLNLLAPPRADNPLRAEETQGQYGLKANPTGFDDGFRPGAYYQWQTVKLAPQTGAVCGNGSPYKFFVNRVPNTRNTIVYLEGGGACWDYPSCSGAAGIRGARNPNGIPDNYLSILGNPGASLVSPFIVRLHPYNAVKTQNWNLIYVPYCTGDIYTGDKVAVYADPAGARPPLVWHHNGLRNTRAVVAWLRDHLPRATQMLATGCSAGGIGALNNYAHLRRDLAPTRGFLIDDSGPAFSAPTGADAQQFPSVRLQAHIRDRWGLDSGPLPFLTALLPAFDARDPGSLYGALAARYAGDRLGHTHFWQDLNYSSYSYERFYPEIEQAPSRAAKDALIHARWAVDTARLRTTLNGLANFGGYFPQFRALNESHCSTVLDFANGDVQELGLELPHFIDSVLNGQGPVLDASEASDAADRAKPINLLYQLVDQLL